MFVYNSRTVLRRRDREWKDPGSNTEQVIVSTSPTEIECMIDVTGVISNFSAVHKPHVS